MKKILSVLLAAFTMILFTACGGSAEKNSAPEEKAEAPADKILVAYFSCTGHTKTAALEVAEILHADVMEIVPAEPYTPADLDYNVENCRANVEQKDSSARPAIKNKIDNPAQYKAIVIAFPIWWGAEPRIIDTFVESYDLRGKTIVPVCTSGGSDIMTAAKNLQGMCKGANVTEGKRLGIISKDEVKAWLETLKL
ncbi:MAG: flavodoxin [Selenomonadaceae bacterium]|nr:flavodoxin [Selenomonadaceae bacterium]MBQ3726379.1 flavodoxin [Selenomonadaceae bacterium]